MTIRSLQAPARVAANAIKVINSVGEIRIDLSPSSVSSLADVPPSPWLPLDPSLDPKGPEMDVNMAWGAPYCLMVILIISVFFMNLFVGVIFDEFEE